MCVLAEARGSARMRGEGCTARRREKKKQRDRAPRSATPIDAQPNPRRKRRAAASPAWLRSRPAMPKEAEGRRRAVGTARAPRMAVPFAYPLLTAKRARSGPQAPAAPAHKSCLRRQRACGRGPGGRHPPHLCSRLTLCCCDVGNARTGGLSAALGGTLCYTQPLSSCDVLATTTVPRSPPPPAPGAPSP